MMDDTTHLDNLLAMIHGDGGHYQNEHGTEKAVVDAIEKYYALRARVEETNLAWLTKHSQQAGRIAGLEDNLAAARARVVELEAEIKAAADAQEKWRQLWTASPVDK